jgi:hypothetical protein
LSEELVNAFNRCPDKLRNRRYIASVKRDCNGAVIPSSITDKCTSLSFAELFDGASSSDFSLPSPPSSLPRIPLPSSFAGAKTGSEINRKVSDIYIFFTNVNYLTTNIL